MVLKFYNISNVLLQGVAGARKCKFLFYRFIDGEAKAPSGRREWNGKKKIFLEYSSLLLVWEF